VILRHPINRTRFLKTPAREKGQNLRYFIFTSAAINETESKEEE
jgi:hypothetical protein